MDTSSATATTGDTAGPGLTAETPVRDWIKVNADATRLRGSVVLSPFPAGSATDTKIWVLGGDDRLVAEGAAPLWPGDYPYPLVLETGMIAFTDLFDVYLIDSRLDGAATAVSEGSFLVPSATRGSAWVLGPGAAWIAGLDTATGVVGERIDVSDTIRWPLAGVAGGLLVAPIDETAYGRVAYWRPDFELESIELRDPAQTELLAAAGDTALFLSPEGVIDVLDIPSRQLRVTFEVDLGEDIIVDGCMSPQQAIVAITISSGRTLVASLDDGSLMQDLTLDQELGPMAWTTPDQLVAIVDGDSGTTLQAVDVFTGTTTVVADLSSSSHGWWMTASGSGC